ncbi:MAG: protein-glutamine glutaminase family protein [Bacteroidota bacterium]
MENYLSTNLAASSLYKEQPTFTDGKACIIEKAKADELFQHILNSEIQFNYVQGNCHNRAHVMCLLMASQGIIPAKVWVFAPGRYTMVDTTLISIDDKNNLAPTGKINWGYHVAPVVYVKNDTGIDTLVFDPSLFPDGPVLHQTWLDALRTEKTIHLFADQEWYLFNYLSFNTAQTRWDTRNSLSDSLGEMPDTGVTLVPSVSEVMTADFFRYEEESKDNHWLEKGLAIDETAFKFYNQEIKPILQTAILPEENHLLSDYKVLVGDVNNFETIFRDYCYNNQVSLAFQEKYSDIINKYREVYNQELSNWKIIIARLLNRTVNC